MRRRLALLRNHDAHGRKLARARIMGARYPYYLLADSPEGQLKEAEVTRSVPSSQPTRGNIRQGFVYERVPHVTLKSIANNAEIDVIWETWQGKLEPLRAALNAKYLAPLRLMGSGVRVWGGPTPRDPVFFDDGAMRLVVMPVMDVSGRKTGEVTP